MGAAGDGSNWQEIDLANASWLNYDAWIDVVVMDETPSLYPPCLCPWAATV